MKLLNILGAVVAVHIAVLVLAIAIPGCRSSNQTTPGGSDGMATSYPSGSDMSSPISAAPEMSDAQLNPALVSDVPPTFDPNAPAMGAGGRSSPTRPSSPVATALQPQTMAEEVRPADTYTVKAGDSLWALAKRNSLTVRELASANGLPADAGLRVGQVLVVPGKRVTTPTVAAAAVETASSSSRMYEIRPGDTLGKIAQAHGTTVAELKAFNRLRSDMVRAGAKIAIPESAPEMPMTSPDTTAVTTSAAPQVAAGTFKHTVAPGESLTVIANRYGVKIGEITLANKVRDPSLIRPGQELIIPGWDAPPVVPTTTTEVAETPATLDISSASEDLDAGFGDEDLSNIPVITVEEPIKTIGGPDGDGPTVFE
jgi:LysM repeat protein